MYVCYKRAVFRIIRNHASIEKDGKGCRNFFLAGLSKEDLQLQVESLFVKAVLGRRLEVHEAGRILRDAAGGIGDFHRAMARDVHARSASYLLQLYHVKVFEA